MRSSKEDILKVLSDIRSGIDNEKVIPINRKKNKDTLSYLGLTWEDAKEIVYNLTVHEYVSGPETDRDRPTSDKLWIFKQRVLGSVIYIKLKVRYKNDGEIVIISFHIDEI